MREIPGMLCFDAGVDGHNFEPWSWPEICEKMEWKIKERNELIRQGKLYERD